MAVARISSSSAAHWKTFLLEVTIVARVEANIANVTQHVAVENLDKLRARIKSFPGMIVKLQGIAGRTEMHTRPTKVLRNYAARV
jgi:hypothetical protein